MWRERGSTLRGTARSIATMGRSGLAAMAASRSARCSTICGAPVAAITTSACRRLAASASKWTACPPRTPANLAAPSKVRLETMMHVRPASVRARPASSLILPAPTMGAVRIQFAGLAGEEMATSPKERAPIDLGIGAGPLAGVWPAGKGRSAPAVPARWAARSAVLTCPRSDIRPQQGVRPAATGEVLGGAGVAASVEVPLEVGRGETAEQPERLPDRRAPGQPRLRRGPGSGSPPLLPTPSARLDSSTTA